MITATIGGALRSLDAWAPTRRLLSAPRVSVDVASLPLETAIDGFPLDYDQQALGSCGPNSLAENFEFRLGFKVSRLFAYWFTRATEGDFLHDDGVTIPDLLDVAHTMGMPHETLWPYEIDQYQIPPPVGVLADAVRQRLERQDVVANLDQLLVELASGQPVMLGFQVPSSMQDGAGSSTSVTGIVREPDANDPIIGGHCVNAIGFSRARRLVKCTCHYGPRFGDGGAIWLPFSLWTAGRVMDMRALRRIVAS